MKKTAILVILLLSFLYSQAQKPQAKMDKKMKAIYALYETDNKEEKVAALKSTFDSLKSSLPLDEETKKIMLQEIDGLLEAMVPFLYDNFSYKELKQIIKARKKGVTPNPVLMEKFLSLLPELTEYITPWAEGVIKKVTEGRKSTAQKIYDNNEPSVSLEKLDSLLIKNPLDYEAYQYKGLCFYFLEQYESAMESINKCLQINSSYAEGYFTKYLIYSIRDEYVGAKEAIEKAVSIDSLDAYYLVNAGNVYNSLGEYQKAIDHFSKAAALTPSDYSIYASKALSYKWNREPEKAKEEFNKALYFVNRAINFSEIRNEDAEIYKAIILVEMEDYTAAMEYYNNLLKEDPENESFLAGRASIYLILKDYEKAFTEYDYLVKNNLAMPHDYNNRGYCLLKLGKYEEALEDFNYLIKNNLSVSFAYSNRGFIKMKKGDYVQAKKDIDYALELMPTNVYAYKTLGLLYLEQGNNQAACKAFNISIEKGFTERFGDEVLELMKQHCE